MRLECEISVIAECLCLRKSAVLEEEDTSGQIHYCGNTCSSTGIHTSDNFGLIAAKIGHTSGVKISRSGENTDLKTSQRVFSFHEAEE